MSYKTIGQQGTPWVTDSIHPVLQTAMSYNLFPKHIVSMTTILETSNKGSICNP